MPNGSRGHRTRPHTADARIEAWADTAEACYEEAVAALVEIFAQTRAVPSEAQIPFDVGPGQAADLLVLLLEEVIVNIEIRGAVPLTTHVGLDGDHLVGLFDVVNADSVDAVGPVPKGVSYEDLAFTPEDGRWQCRATIDV